jgi:hypothetical protein
LIGVYTLNNNSYEVLMYWSSGSRLPGARANSQKLLSALPGCQSILENSLPKVCFNPMATFKIFITHPISAVFLGVSLLLLIK